jgi:hypothetical protein
VDAAGRDESTRVDAGRVKPLPGITTRPRTSSEVLRPLALHCATPRISSCREPWEGIRGITIRPLAIAPDDSRSTV